VKGNHRVYLPSATLYPSARRAALTEEMRKQLLVFKPHSLEKQLLNQALRNRGLI